MRAAIITPVESTAAYLARFTDDSDLPRYSGGSAPTLALSRPSQCSLTLRPARSADPLRGLSIEVLQIIRRLLIRSDRFRLEREFAGPDFHRGERCALPRHTEQSGREFGSTDTTTRAQDATLQIARFSPALPVDSRRRLQHLQHPAPSHVPRHAPRPQRRSIPEMGSGYCCLSPSWPSKLRTANLSSCDSDLCTMGQVARGGARPTDPRSREACPLEMSMKSASRRTRVHPATPNYPIA